MSPVAILATAAIAAATLLSYLACLGAAALPDVRRLLLDAIHRRRVAQLRATLDREERRHQQADGRDGESA